MPVKKVHVRDHDRRKPHQDQHIHVDDYNRMQDIRRGPPPGREDLGPRERPPLVVDGVVLEGPNPSIFEGLCPKCGTPLSYVDNDENERSEAYCEHCGWADKTGHFAKSWDIDTQTEKIEAIEKELHPTQEFLRMGDTGLLEQGLLDKFGLGDDYDDFDEVPKEVLDKVKCPHCSGRQFSLWGEPESYGMGSIDLDKAHLEEDDHDYLLDMASQGGNPTKLVCDKCSSEFGSLEL